MTFEGQLVSLCRLLEQWRAECNAEDAADPDDFPSLNWRAAGCSLIFYVLGLIAVFEHSHLRYVQGIPALAFDMIILVIWAICSGAGLVLGFHTFGLFDRQFWRSARLLFKKRGNYPFTPLIRTIEKDSAGAKRLATFTNEIIVAANQRIRAEEAELRDRIITLVGPPSLTALAGLFAGAWANWKSFHGSTGPVEILLGVLSVGLLALVVYGLKLRIALFELTRCQGMLSLEITRRKMESEEPRVSEPPPSAQRTAT